ncbi:MAG: hypothetical protein WA876_11280 [Candidatus Acidiferrales bacterium]
MPQNALATTSKPPASPSNLLARKWIVVFGELFAREITPELVSAWCMLLGDIEPRLLDQACDRTARTCKFFPTVADVRAQLDQAAATAFELDAERAWHELLAWVKRFFHPDLGVTCSAPQLDPAIEFAARAAGGFRWLETCSESELQWAKKRFVEALSRQNKAGETAQLLGDGEAKRALRILKAGPLHAEQKRIVAVVIPGTQRLSPPSPQPSASTVMTEEELERRKRDQRERLKEWESARCGSSTPTDAEQLVPE